MHANIVDKTRMIDIAYGHGTIPFYANPKLAEWHIIRPAFAPPLPNAEQAFHVACHNPIASKPLREVIRPGDRVVIVTSDGTRPVPNRQLIPWLLQELPVPAKQVAILLGNGSHRANTPAEIEVMFGKDVVKEVAILNHNAFDPQQNVCIGQTAKGHKAYLNKIYVEADKRIVVGFIEPHFFAGFSGGAKGIIPGIASIDTILHIHRFDLIAHPLSTWGTVEDNPIRREIEAMVSLCPPDFMVNVTLNSAKEITALFVGDYIEAHRAGCQRAKEEVMQPVPHAFPIVVTSNSGYPLDQNLYQTVKGISAGARITEPGGTIFVASECSDGIPDHGNFGELMCVGTSADDILEHIVNLEQTILDQWEAQVYAYLMQKYDIRIYCAMDHAVVKACKLQPVDDLQAAVEEQIRAMGYRPRVAVLPDGPLTIPYIAK
nr:nickel-dependent lactate racemase [Chloroflexota bacterium]